MLYFSALSYNNGLYHLFGTYQIFPLKGLLESILCVYSILLSVKPVNHKILMYIFEIDVSSDQKIFYNKCLMLTPF